VLGHAATPPGPVSLAHALDVWGCVVSYYSPVFSDAVGEELGRRFLANPDLYRDIRDVLQASTKRSAVRAFDTVTRTASRARTSERETKLRRERERRRESEQDSQSAWSAARDRSRSVARQGVFSSRSRVRANLYYVNDRVCR